jgi:hypothetical protein
MTKFPKLQRGDVLEAVVACEDCHRGNYFWKLIFPEHPEKFGVLSRSENFYPGQTAQVKIKSIAGNRINCYLSRKGGLNGNHRKRSESVSYRF